MMTIVLLLAIGTAAHAQRNWGVRGGINVNSIANTNTGGLDRAENIQSFHAGLQANIPVFFMFSIQPSLLATGKGARITNGDQNGTGDYFVAEANPIYLELPVTFNLNPHFGDFSGLYIGAGPYIAMGIGGKNRVYGRNDGTEFGSQEKIRWSDDDPKTLATDEGAAYGTFRKFDYGATLNIGLYLSRLQVGVFYDHGFTKINTVSNSEQDDRMYLRTIGFTAGLNFGH